MSLFDLLFSNIRKKRDVIESDNPNPAYANSFANSAHSYTGSNVNYQLARDIYRNVDNRYALSAHLTKPIIDSAVSFIDMPSVVTNNTRIKKALLECQNALAKDSMIRIAEREGTCFVWLQYKDGKVKFVVPRPETIKTLVIDPKTKDIVGYIIEDVFTYTDIDGNSWQRTDKIKLTDKQMTVETQSTDHNTKSTTTTVPNVLGFIPIARFVNDVEPWELRGHSELSSIEPTLKLYNDLMVDAANSQKQNSPKMKIMTKNVKQFIENNFGVGAFDRVRGGAKLSMEDKDLYILQRDMNDEGDDMAYVATANTTGDSPQLLEIAFSNLVEGSQRPELLFGASMGASLSSVQEQRPAFIRLIRRKQKQYGIAWKSVFDMYLAIVGYAAYATFTPDAYSLEWADPDFATDKEKADTANMFITALVKARSNGLLSDEEIHNTLVKRGYVEINRDYKQHLKELDETQERIIKEAENKSKNDEMIDRIATGKEDQSAVEQPDKKDKTRKESEE